MQHGNRRESRIPRPSAPLGDRSNVAATGGKRKAGALESVPEPSKRGAAAFPSGSGAAAVPAADVQTGPAPGDEAWEDIAERTGTTETGLLGRKMAFKKAMRPEKKVEDLVPMVKELRALGWYLHAGKSRAALDSESWKSHSEDLDRQIAEVTVAADAAAKEADKQLSDVRAALVAAEARGIESGAALAAAEKSLGETGARLEEAARKLRDTEGSLARTEATLAEKETKIKGMEEVIANSQSYSSTLQSYNATLQADLNSEKAKREEVTKARDELQARASELAGMSKGLEGRLQFDADQVTQLRTERDAATRDVALLRADLDSTRLERDRLLADNQRLSDEYKRIKELGGNSIEKLEALMNDKATLEVQLSTQQKLIAGMRQELGVSKEERAIAEGDAAARSGQVDELKAQLESTRASLEEAEARLHRNELIRRKLHNTVLELKGNIRVFCRVRPVSAAEVASADHDASLALDFPESNDLLSAPIGLQVPSRDGNAMLNRHAFSFDRVFTPTAGQEAVFEEISELVQSALDGQKVCIFAYGQTGSGKTHTMLGSAGEPGVIPRAMTQIFEYSAQLVAQGWAFSMTASMLEIYNEEYKDLLAKRAKPGGHKVVHAPDGVTTVTDLTLVDITQPARVEALLADAMDKRAVGCTALNEQSSRSHMVFTLRLDGTNAQTGKTVSGVLNLIDLAGSERVKESGASGVRMKEAQAINTSLSALGDVIVALATKAQHVPFRNSKLTYLLQPCLGGDAKTLMFVNVAPTGQFSNETLCSLRFASKVNACEINHQPKRKGPALNA
ncbi:hypothetical protein FOA52_013279 [Chlamydomonas sp. UWO 241]|nr:hypothetical protein FOA52_013279 [Chlamydomonas sp. UWO 241]